MSAPYQGPSFLRVPEIAWEELSRRGGFGPRNTPILVKGAIRPWPAYERWTFENLAALRRNDGSEVMFEFQNGLVEQGVTRPPLMLPIGPYLQELASSPPLGEGAGLVPNSLWQQIGFDDTFHLNWDYMSSFVADKVYLAQWNILDEFPELRNDFAIRKLWPGWRWTWEYVFIGPARTVTGIHYDFPDNWFCQLRGTKEFIIFPLDQSRYLSRSMKYDWGATLSDVDISQLDARPKEKEEFAKARGWYTRVESGDALFIPKRNWHAVVSMEPSISLGVFGLTAPEALMGGIPAEAKNLLHKLHLYRWNNCTCHRMTG